jgi:hypothetical protein
MVSRMGLIYISVVMVAMSNANNVIPQVPMAITYLHLCNTVTTCVSLAAAQSDSVRCSSLNLNLSTD